MASSCANNLLGDSPTTGITVCISSVRFSYLLFFSFLFFSFLFFSFLFFSFLFFSFLIMYFSQYSTEIVQ